METWPYTEINVLCFRVLLYCWYVDSFIKRMFICRIINPIPYSWSVPKVIVKKFYYQILTCSKISCTVETERGRHWDIIFISLVIVHTYHKCIEVKIKSPSPYLPRLLVESKLTVWNWSKYGGLFWSVLFGAFFE